MTSLLQDLRHSLRVLARSPGFAAISILTLALAIGANTAIFSVVDAVLLRPLPYRDPAQLYIAWESSLTQARQPKIFASYRDFRTFAEHNSHFDALAAYTWAVADQTLTGFGDPRLVTVLPATPNLFSVLGVEPELGRTFNDDDPNRGCTVVLSHKFFQNVLGGDRSRVGGAITIDGESCTFAGVMPAWFTLYPAATELWSVMRAKDPLLMRPKQHLLAVLGRLKPGTTPTAAAEELAALRRGLEQADSDRMTGVGINLQLIQDEFTWLSGRNLRSGLLLLSATVGFVLLIACLNVANLFMERTTARRREFAVRLALGARPRRLVRQLLTESCVVAGIGALFGICLSTIALAVFRAVQPLELPPGASLRFDARVLVFTVALSALTALLFGAFPAWQTSRLDLHVAMKSARGSAPPGQRWATRAIVIGQVALSLVLIVAASLLIGSALRMANESPGFDRHGLLSFRLTIAEAQYANAAQQVAFFDQLIATLQSLPGTRGAALASVAPLAAGSQGWVSIEGRPQPQLETAPLDVGFNNVSAGYFELLGIPLQRGRLFETGDAAGSEAVAIVNRAFVARYFPGEDPLGRHVRLSADASAPWLTIVGIVGDTKRVDVFHEMGWLTGPQLYRPVAQNPYATINVILRTISPPLGMVPSIQHTIAGVNGTLAIRGVRTVDDRLDEIMAAPRLRAALLGAFAALSLLLSGVGIYGVLAQNVVQRRHEMGIRMALGAHPRDVQRLVLAQGARLAAIGLLLGGVGAYLNTRLLASFVYQLRPADAWTSALAGSFVALAALLATYIPARRATTVDPVAVLRTE